MAVSRVVARVSKRRGLLEARVGALPGLHPGSAMLTEDERGSIEESHLNSTPGPTPRRRTTLNVIVSSWHPCCCLRS